MLWPTLLLPLPLLSFVYAALIPEPRHIPSPWYLPNEHPVITLFNRGIGDYAPVGSPTWSSGFPQSTPDASQLPQEWVNAYHAAVTAGSIPNIPPSSNTPGVNPVYPSGLNPNGPEVCSTSYRCRHPDDIWDAPTGYFAAAFDDGPLPPTSTLIQFLNQNNEIATHFMIGTNILRNPQSFLAAFNAGNDIAIHTWTHPYMTTLSDLEIVGQLGWTSLLIRNSTGGLVPRFWRPPYGDSDNRVRAIAKEVFGLTTVLWNQDTGDWSLTLGGANAQKIEASFQQWLTGPKSPGLIVLEHELTEASVQSFINAYPLIKSNGWNFASLTKAVGGETYQNAQNSTSSVTPSGASSQSESGTATSSNGNSLQASHTSFPTSSGMSHAGPDLSVMMLSAVFLLAVSFL